MRDHREKFADYFAHKLRHRYPSSICGENWLIGAAELYAKDSGQSLVVVVDTLNAQREPTRRILDDCGVQEHFKTKPVTITITEKTYIRTDNNEELT